MLYSLDKIKRKYKLAFLYIFISQIGNPQVIHLHIFELNYIEFSSMYVYENAGS